MGAPRRVGLRAGVAEGHEDILPARLVVAPALALEDEGPLGAVGHDEAVHHVVDLAPEPAALVEVAGESAGRVAVLGILEEMQSGLDQGAQLLGFPFSPCPKPV